MLVKVLLVWPFLLFFGMVSNTETPTDGYTALRMQERILMMNRMTILVEEMFKRLETEEIQERLAELLKTQQIPPSQLYQWTFYLPIMVFCILWLWTTFRMLFKGMAGKVFIGLTGFLFYVYMLPFVWDYYKPHFDGGCSYRPLEPAVGPEPSLTIGWMFHFYIAFFIQGLHMLVEDPFLKMFILFLPLLIFSYLTAYGLKTLVRTYVRYGVYHRLKAPEILLVLILWLALHYIVCIILRKFSRGAWSNKLTIVILLLEFAVFYWMNALDVTSLPPVKIDPCMI